MAHNNRVRAPGAWTGTLLWSELDQLDNLQSQALSKRGGAWAPSSSIEIGGAQGLEITGPSHFDQVMGVQLASAQRVNYGSYSVEREHSVIASAGYGFAVRDIDLGLLNPVFTGREQPALVQTIADVAPTSTPRRWVPLPLPVGCVITKLAITLSASRAHAFDDALPQTMPQLTLRRGSGDNGTATAGTASVDPSATMLAYRAMHDVVVTTFTSPTFDGTQLWWAVIEGEYGIGAMPDLYISSVRTTVTQTAHDEFQT